MSSKRPSNAGVPISGGVSEVAPVGAQTVNSEAQLISDSLWDANKRAIRAKNEDWRMRMLNRWL